MVRVNKKYFGKPFGNIAIELGLITPLQLDEALALKKVQRNRLLGELMVKRGIIDENGLMRILSEQKGIAIINLDKRRISDRVKSLMDQPLALLYRVVPVSEKNGHLTVAGSQAACNQNFLDILSQLLDVRIILALTSKEQLERKMLELYGINFESLSDPLSAVPSISVKPIPVPIETPVDSDSLEEQVKDLQARVARLENIAMRFTPIG